MSNTTKTRRPRTPRTAAVGAERFAYLDDPYAIAVRRGVVTGRSC